MGIEGYSLSPVGINDTAGTNRFYDMYQPKVFMAVLIVEFSGREERLESGNTGEKGGLSCLPVKKRR
ncbi:hypothetical protein K0M31_004536 [Melipona bicolor]|uniref:Uncharacterized protein n=1 Tax=Melipona bicolor TaxID=60889 RepID=A0AA40FXQ9_9HYME|nr:hypothetical protein K0M31_004536 [Melipona bicolor]